MQNCNVTKTRVEFDLLRAHSLIEIDASSGGGSAYGAGSAGRGICPPSAVRDNRGREGDDLNTGVITKTKPKTQKPNLYKVLLLNDDYTPMDFVVYVLKRYFNKSVEEATQIMLHVHQKGVGICGVYTYEIAETKVTQVMSSAQQNQHPLQCTMEKE